jgi:hypothetical protein
MQSALARPFRGVQHPLLEYAKCIPPLFVANANAHPALIHVGGAK